MQKIILLLVCTQALCALEKSYKIAFTSWLAEEVAAINAAFDPIQVQHKALITPAPSRAIKTSAAFTKLLENAKMHSKSKDSV